MARCLEGTVMRSRHVPALITGRVRNILQQAPTSAGRLPVVFLEEFNDQPPLRVEVRLGCHQAGKSSEGHRLVTHVHRVASAANAYEPQT